jgi:hypothetical protein
MVLELGFGGLIYFFALGPWFLPGALSLALPAGALGGVLLTRAEDSVIAAEDSTRETVRLAVLTVLLSAISVGWLVPLAPTRRRLERPRFFRVQRFRSNSPK